MIINGELHDRARRRRLPGLDDGLQRRLRGRPDDHRADEPRALHQPLPAGPRRDRQLPGHRPQVRQRHRPLAAAAHVRRLVLARRSNLYGTPLHRRVVERDARRSSRPGPPPVEEGPRPDARRRRRRVVDEHGRAAAVDERRRARSTRRTASCSTTTPGTRPTSARRAIVRVGTKPKPKPKPKTKPKGTTTPAADDAADDSPRARRRRRTDRTTTTPAQALASAAAIASASQAGTRVGRSVVASTQAWRVQPSATISSPSRSTAYSKRKRAPRSRRSGRGS